MKHGPKTEPGAMTKLKTALNKFMGVGSDTAVSKRRDKRVSSVDH